MSNPDYDAEFEAFLRGRARLERRFPRLERLEPPPELDRIIIRQARDAIQPPASSPPFRTPRWAAPMALAATLLVSFSLMLDVGLRQAIHHDAAPAPIVLEFPQNERAARETELTTQIAPAATEEAQAEAQLTSPAPRAVRPKVQLERNSITTARPRALAAAPASQPAPAAKAAIALAGRSVAGAVAISDSPPTRTRADEPARYADGYAPIRLALASNDMQTIIVVGQRHLATVTVSAAIAAQGDDREMANFHSNAPAIPIPDLPSTLLGGGG